MLRSALLALPILLAGSLAAQTDAAALQAKLDEKLATPFLTKAEWSTDYDQARTLAKAKGKVILAYFTRSYAA